MAPPSVSPTPKTSPSITDTTDTPRPRTVIPWSETTTPALMAWLRDLTEEQALTQGPTAREYAMRRRELDSRTRVSPPMPGLLARAGWPETLPSDPDAKDGPCVAWWRALASVLTGLREHLSQEGAFSSSDRAAVLRVLRWWIAPPAPTSLGSTSSPPSEPWWATPPQLTPLSSVRHADSATGPVWSDPVMAGPWSAASLALLRTCLAPVVKRLESLPRGATSEDIEGLVDQARELTIDVERMGPGLGGARAQVWLAMLSPTQRLVLATHWLDHASPEILDTFQLLIGSPPVRDAAACVSADELRPLLRRLLTSERGWQRELGVCLAGRARENAPGRSTSSGPDAESITSQGPTR